MWRLATYTIAWIVWVVYFFVVEVSALLRRRKGGTLSEHVWALFNIRAGRADWRTWVGRIVLLIFGIWLTGHFAFGWWSVEDPCGPFC